MRKKVFLVQLEKTIFRLILADPVRDTWVEEISDFRFQRRGKIWSGTLFDAEISIFDCRERLKKSATKIKQFVICITCKGSFRLAANLL